MNIICVDDEIPALRVLKDAIEENIKASDSLMSFSSPLNALKYASTKKVDVAFLDISMNEINGIDLAIKLKEKNPNINIIFSTGYDEYMQDAINLIHVSGYVLKPITPKKIEKSLNSLLFNVNKENELNIEVTTYGDFEFLVNGKPLKYKRSKAKELLAILVDAKGKEVDRSYLVNKLFPGKELDKSLQSYLSKIIASLEDTIKEAKIKDFLVLTRNTYKINVKMITCDSYEGEFDKKSPYMSQYSWGKSQ